MKKLLLYLLVLIISVSSVSAFAEDRFVDSETGLSFAIPSGWETLPNTSGNQSIKIQYTPSINAGQNTLAFSTLDFYTVLGLSQYGLSRRDIDFSMLDDDVVAWLLGPLEAKTDQVKLYNSYQYRVITCTIERQKAGLTFSFDCEMVFTLVNGYVISFQYMAMNNYDLYHPVFEDAIRSVKFN